MLIVEYEKSFLKKLSKIKNLGFKEKITKLIEKIIENPNIGKPMMYDRRGTLEVYLQPYRLSYKFFKVEEKIVFVDFYHKDEQ